MVTLPLLTSTLVCCTFWKRNQHTSLKTQGHWWSTTPITELSLPASVKVLLPPSIQSSPPISMDFVLVCQLTVILNSSTRSFTLLWTTKGSMTLCWSILRKLLTLFPTKLFLLSSSKLVFLCNTAMLFNHSSLTLIVLLPQIGLIPFVLISTLGSNKAALSLPLCSFSLWMSCTI